MIELVQAAQSPALQSLWHDVLDDLRDVYDLHFVCEVFATQIAVHFETRAMIAMEDTETHNYDVWISEPSAEVVRKRWPSESAGLAEHFAHSQPVYLTKLEQPASEILSSRLWLEAHNALLVVPLKSDHQAYRPFPATLATLIDPPATVLNDSSVVTRVAELMCVFMDRAAMRQELDRKAVEFEVITDISRVLSSTLNIQQIYELLTGPIRQTLNVETLSIGLVEAYTGDIVFVEKLLGPRFDRLPPIRVRKGQGIAGWVADHREPVIINDVYSDRRFYSGVDRKSGFRTNSMICIPLKVDERCIGVLQAINRRFGNFTKHDLRLMEGLGSPLAAAIENANLNAILAAEKQRFDTLYGNISDGLVAINPDGIITQSNSSFISILYDHDEPVVGSKLVERLQVARGDMGNFIDGVFAAEDGLQQLVEVIRENGRTIPVLLSGLTVPDSKGTSPEAILILSDLTQIMEVERMREDLFQGIVHELHTPLAAILLYSRLLRDVRDSHTEKFERFLGVIERESDRLQRMIKQSLDLVKLESHEMLRTPGVLSLNVVFEETLPELAARAVGKGLLFRQRIEPDLPPIVGQDEAFRLILGILLDNAIKFTPSGGIQVSAWSSDGSVQIEIKDDGIGIPAESIAHVFKRFYRTQLAVERGLAGSGLGLYVVKESLDNYNGQISAESTVGKGTVFTIRLPVAET